MFTLIIVTFSRPFQNQRDQLCILSFKEFGYLFRTQILHKMQQSMEGLLQVNLKLKSLMKIAIFMRTLDFLEELQDQEWMEE